MTRSITRRKEAFTEDDLSLLSLTKQRPEMVGLLHIKAPKRQLRHLFKRKDNVGMKPIGKKVGYK